MTRDLATNITEWKQEGTVNRTQAVCLWRRRHLVGMMGLVVLSLMKPAMKIEAQSGESVEAKIATIIIDLLGVEEPVRNEDRFVEDLGASSTDMTEFVMALEEEFGIEIDEEDAKKILTVGDAIEYVKRWTANRE